MHADTGISQVKKNRKLADTLENTAPHMSIFIGNPGMSAIQTVSKT